MSTAASPEEVADLVRQMMEAYATDAVDAARANYGIELDYSPGSVKTVEGLLGKIYPAVRRGWFRKLFRIGLGALGNENVIALVNGDDKIFPPSKVFKRLMNGEEDDVWFYFLVVTDGLAPVG